MEALLRPPVELNSAVTACACSALAFIAPESLLLTPDMGAIAGCATLAFGAVRARQASRVMRYQRGLKRYKLTYVAPHKIPVSNDMLYIGQGFRWTQLHTQRKTDAMRYEAKPFVDPSKWIERARRFERWAEKKPMARAFAQITTKQAWWNPLARQLDLGGTPILHGVEPNEVQVLLGQRHRNGHLIVLGTTRVGKTRLMEILMTQDIHSGKVVIVIDPKGDADLMMRVYAEANRAGRLDQLYLFHLGYPEISARYNGIGNFARITEVATRTTNALPAAGNSAAFKEFAWRFTNLVAQAQVALGRVPTYELILRDISDIEPLFLQYARHVLESDAVPHWLEQLEEIDALIEKKKLPVPRPLQDRSLPLIAMVHLLKVLALEDPVLNGLATAVRYEKSFFEKIVASLGPFLEKLTTGNTGKLISPDYFDVNDKRPIFDWMQVIRQNGIVYVGLDALSDATVAGAVGNSMLADLVSVGGKLYKTGLDPHHPDGNIVLPIVACHFDEVNELMGAEFVPMVNKLGGAGFWISAYTQTVPDIEAKVGDAAKAKQILGNFNNVVMLRVKDQGTAEFFTDQLPKVEVSAMTVVSGVTDGSGDGSGTDFVSRNEDSISTQSVPIIEPADIMSLPQGQAFALLEGNRLWKIRMPMPDTIGDDYIPASLRAVGESMRDKYRFADQSWTQTDWMNDHPIGLTGDAAVVSGPQPGTVKVPVPAANTETGI
ncbi:MAG: type IV conjugative transfer system coupling protein TraD [Herminiimonas sp.]|nr:type IV conjugative transfer system coupling protein TraD [Herminiimonas sp.]